ncbi:Transmembrane and coiled-coil domain-containing protein 4 [Phytophthora boehmeriae]|uniref:Transmembrane and coiled-coil domain-containing protein 4 n=1 Tax=Phytophthora boehmeriae TaxID=109152 RepID=A0A8T1WVI6_9STRA|nr:Transmembrane and coiled-coil domain-containing protein 4 [Phytophthora boehmeriae]
MTASQLQCDCQELHRRGFLSSERLQQLSATCSSSSAAADEISTLLLEEIDAIVERVRQQHNTQEQEAALGNSELAAVAVGGALGALNAWLRPSASTTGSSSTAGPSTTKATSLWASAYDGAVATLNVAKRKRRVQQLQLRKLSGDAATCSHVVLCINGFMTQSDDPVQNWRVWCEDQNAVVFAVQWEAGDAAAWNEFCTHVNDNLSSSSVSAMVAHFTGNPWHSAQGKAEQVGVLLSQVLAERPAMVRGRKISLFGHSLGGAVIYSAFQELAKLRKERSPEEVPVITNAVSLAGAYIPDIQGLENITQSLDPQQGKFINVFSARDGVLSKLFWALQLPGQSGPGAAGCAAVTFAAAAANCINVEVSDLVVPRVENHFGHSYTHFMESIKTRVLPYLTKG